MTISLNSVITHTLSAALANIPTFYGMEVKTAQQLNREIPFFGMQSLLNGLASAPMAGIITGMQMTTQNVLEKKLTKGGDDFLGKLKCAALVGVLSAPLLAMYNGQSMGLSLSDSFLNLTPRQVFAITVKETAFVFSLQAGDMLEKELKPHFGENKITQYACAFISSALGSLVVHPADTALTRSQARYPKAQGLAEWMAGATAKAVSAGAFSVLYGGSQ